MRGTFIVLDGPDGSGTTTHAALLAKTLIERGLDVLLTSEPTKDPIGVWIRQLLKSGAGVSGLPLQILFCADRAAHAESVIRPALEAGKVVICDRYSLSTLIYARAQGIDDAALRHLNASFLQPDCTIFTLPSLAVCLDRIRKRGERDAFENEAFQTKIHREYKAMLKEMPTILRVDTAGPTEDAAKTVAAMADAVLARKKKTAGRTEKTAKRKK
jgi:dTMP kinase